MKNAVLNSERSNQCNIKAVKHLIVQYYNITISNSAIITIAITANATTISAIWKGRIVK